VGCKHYFEKDLILGRQVAIGMSSQVHIVKIKDNSNFEKVEIAGKLINEKAGVTTKDFIREVRLLQIASENCDNIINILGIVLKPKVILMEYYKNGSLDQALLKDYHQHVGEVGGEFPILCCLRFVLQLTNAVTHLQKNNIVHRDLASRNLLLSDDRKSILLADFGLARITNINYVDQNVTDTVAIPITSPPESWTRSSESQRSYGLKTDVWSLGMTAYEIVNKRPIKKNDLSEMKQLKGTNAIIPKKLLRDDIKIGNSFKRTIELWAIMSRCWAIDPKKRPQVWEVSQSLTNLLKLPIGNYIRSFEDERDGFDIRLFDTKSNTDAGSSTISCAISSIFS